MTVGSIQNRQHHHHVKVLPANVLSTCGACPQARKNAVIQGRQGLLERQQPGAGEALLAFCDQRGAAAFRLPWFARWAPLVEPLLAEARLASK